MADTSLYMTLDQVVWKKNAKLLLMDSSQTRDVLAGTAAQVAARANAMAGAGAEYGSTSAKRDRSRVGPHAFAHTANLAAMEDNARNNTLAKSI